MTRENREKLPYVFITAAGVISLPPVSVRLVLLHVYGIYCLDFPLACIVESVARQNTYYEIDIHKRLEIIHLNDLYVLWVRFAYSIVLHRCEVYEPSICCSVIRPADMRSTE